MELRLDRLLADLRDRPATILQAIDTDPLLLKRNSGDLVLANATKALYTPQTTHQLYAKGIVYRRDPYQLVSLPLIKIYNLGERDVTVPDLVGLLEEPNARLRFLRKMDGSLIQVFRHEGRVYLTTRGMIEGGGEAFAEEDEVRPTHFDYLGAARTMMQSLYPRVLEDPAVTEGRTLLFELLHPQARKVTNYGDRVDLVFLSCFDLARFAYLGYEELQALGATFGLTTVEALSPPGGGLAQQIESLLAALAGSDEEGSVLCFERAGEIIYRVKVKTPDYLQLMRLMAFCTYERTVEMIDANPQVQSWADLEALLQQQGKDRVPEEVLGFYRGHWERFQTYLRDLDRLRAWGEAKRDEIDAAIGGSTGRDPREYRKAFAALAVRCPHPALAFAALDGGLDRAKLRKLARTDEELREVLGKLG